MGLRTLVHGNRLRSNSIGPDNSHITKRKRFRTWLPKPEHVRFRAWMKCLYIVRVTLFGGEHGPTYCGYDHFRIAGCGVCDDTIGNG